MDAKLQGIDKKYNNVTNHNCHSHTILVVEDDPVTSLLIRKVLQKEGFQTELAMTGSDAISSIVKNPCTLLLLDYQLPDMTGEQIIESLSNLQCSVPFIVLTATGSVKLAVKMMKVGAKDFIVKEKGFHRLVPTIVRQIIKQLEVENKLIEVEEALRKAHKETELLLSSISSILIGVGPDYRITRWNATAKKTFDIEESDAIGKIFSDCSIEWNWGLVMDHITECRAKDQPTKLDDIRYIRPDGNEGTIAITVNPIISKNNEHSGFLLLGADITERRILESQLAQAQKLESVGQLASGIAHEINTPIQYIGDNSRFLDDAFCDLRSILAKYDELLQTVKKRTPSDPKVEIVETAAQEGDLEYLVNEIPIAIQQTLDGVDRVAKIVNSMKEFSHPGEDKKTTIDINNTIESTIIVSRSEWKHVANIVTNFDQALPQVPCFSSAFNQVILNMIINAIHAISDVVGDGSKAKGTITISTKHLEDWAEIRINDTGTGIPKSMRHKIFDPFFTTKEIGKGTGQGLAISHSVVVEKHQGTITFKTEMGKGTTFIIRLPIESLNK